MGVLGLVCASLVGLSLAQLDAVDNPLNPKPNVFIWLMDDMGRADNTVDFTGNTQFQEAQGINTPNMVKYTASGVNFNNAYVQPQCTPTRYAVMAGRWPHRAGLGAFALPSAGQDNSTPVQFPFVSGLLKEKLGYYTAAYGKWHLGYNNVSVTPVGRGFDHFIGFLQGEGEHYSHLFQGSYDWFEQSAEDPSNIKVRMDQNEIYNDQIACEETFKLIDRKIAREITKPIFVYVALANPHTPHDEPPADLYQNATLIAGCATLWPVRALVCRIVAWQDTHFGAFMTKLQSNPGFYKDTMVIFSADNGGLPHYEISGYPTIPINHRRLARFGGNGFNYPLRGGKATAFEGGCRTPLSIIGGVNVIPPSRRGAVVSDLVHAIDWPATILEYAGASKDEIKEWGLDGISFKDAITKGNNPGKRTELVLNLAVNNPEKSQLYWTSFRQGDYKIVVRDPDAPPHIYDGWYPASAAGTGVTYFPASAVPTVVDSLNTPNYMLFNLVSDPFERDNLLGRATVAQADVDRFNQMNTRLRSFYVPQCPFVTPIPPATQDGTYLGILYPFQAALPRSGPGGDSCPLCNSNCEKCEECEDCPDCTPKCRGRRGGGGGGGGGRRGGGGDGAFSFNNFAL